MLMISKPETNKIAGFILIMITMTLTQYFLSEKLEKLSVPFIIYLQGDSHLVKSMELVSLIGSKEIKFSLLLTIFCTCNVYHAFIYTFASYFSMFACSWLKLIWQQPRPYWLSDDITPFECDPGFGYPSNHVLSTVVSFLVFFEIMYEHFHIKSFVNSKIIYWLGFSASFLLCAFVGFGRMVLGVHSIDQVMFGLLIGLAIYYFILHLTDFKVDNYDNFLNLISNKYRTSKLMLLTLSIYFLFLVNIYFMPTVYNPEYVGRVLLKCPSSTPFGKSLLASGQYFMIIGMLIGIFYDVRSNYLENSETNDLPSQYIEDNFCKSDMVQDSDYSKLRTASFDDSNYNTYLITFVRMFIIYFMSRVINFICSFIMVMFGTNLITKFLFLQVLNNLSVGIFLFGFGRNFGDMFRLNLKKKVF